MIIVTYLDLLNHEFFPQAVILLLKNLKKLLFMITIVSFLIANANARENQENDKNYSVGAQLECTNIIQLFYIRISCIHVIKFFFRVQWIICRRL